MNVVLIIPTGIGCEIGGHAGDANPVAKLIGACCDKLILHPNVVNASDINEMPPNALYVEGSILDRFLEGDIELKEVKRNRILVVVNSPILAETINAVSAARVTLGIDATMLELDVPLQMISKMEGRKASGEVYGWKELVQQVNTYDFDALAIASLIEVSKDVSMYYYKNGGINPWGGVEAITSKLIASELNKPVAHAPIQTEEDKEADKAGEWDFIVDPRIAPEIISKCYLHCVLKGLHKAPRIGEGLRVDDIDCLITPVGCVGRSHKACLEAEIPIIAVKENKTVLNDPMPDEFIFVDNYIEAAGLLMSMQAGIVPESVRRPLLKTIIRRNP